MIDAEADPNPVHDRARRVEVTIVRMIIPHPVVAVHSLPRVTRHPVAAVTRIDREVQVASATDVTTISGDEDRTAERDENEATVGRERIGGMQLTIIAQEIPLPVAAVMVVPPPRPQRRR